MPRATKLEREMVEYVLTDYEFLEDYEIIENGNSKSTFLAQIKNSTQKVRFVKRKFSP
jgi:ribosomal protein S8